MKLSKTMLKTLREAANLHTDSPMQWAGHYKFSSTRNTLDALVKRDLLRVRGEVKRWGTEIHADLREYQITPKGLDIAAHAKTKAQE